MWVGEKGGREFDTVSVSSHQHIFTATLRGRQRSHPYADIKSNIAQDKEQLSL